MRGCREHGTSSLRIWAIRPRKVSCRTACACGSSATGRSPHLTVRRYRNSEQLAETLQFLSDEGAAREALILAGDVEPAGSLKDSLDVVNSGVLEQERT